MKLDGETIQELYKRGLLTEKAVKHINIVNSVEALKKSDPKHAISRTARKFNCSRQNIYAVLKKNRGE